MLTVPRYLFGTWMTVDDSGCTLGTLAVPLFLGLLQNRFNHLLLPLFPSLQCSLLSPHPAAATNSRLKTPTFLFNILAA